MPNWCTNLIKISGNEDNLQRFISDFTRSGNLAMSNILPTPSYLLYKASEPTKTNIFVSCGDNQAYQMDWYKWRLFHWGVKWDLSVPEVCECLCSDNTYAFVCMTPWCAPSEFFKYISDMYNLDIVIYGYEPGVCFISVDLFGRWGNYSKDYNTDKNYEELQKSGLRREDMVYIMSETDYDNVFKGIPYPWDEEDNDE